MKRLISAAAVFALLLIAVCTAAVMNEKKLSARTGDQAVMLNEIERLAESGDTAGAAECAASLRREILAGGGTDSTPLYVMCGICIVFLAGAVIYIYFTVAAPFARLSAFAERVALGDLEQPLEYERGNLFGKFTWAFDSMRSEILKARTCEKEAIENNKTVIASLSHDIKTPISSIRAYAEALELGMDADPDKRARYIGIILRKCDEVSHLTEDMLTHSLTELDRLKMSPEVFSLNEALSGIITDISAERDDIVYEAPSYSIDVYADRNRLAQIVENLVNNARKYAKTPVEIRATRDENSVFLHFTDHGGGIPYEELPFVCTKFYRGKNSRDEKGAGLGLYIVKYIAVQSGGDLMLKNTGDGLEATVSLPLSDDT